MQFIMNLRPRSVHAFSNMAAPQAWLLSTHRLSRTTLRHAIKVRENGARLFADNGTKKLIEQVKKQFSSDAAVIKKELRKLRRKTGKIPRGRNIPVSLRKKISELAGHVVESCVQISSDMDWKELLTEQLSMHPTDIIAQEDFSIACLISLGLERESTGWPIRSYTRMNRRSLKLWQRVVDDPRCQNINVYAVLSAMDYNTARKAGRLAALSGVSHVAVGMAAVNLDRSAVDFYQKGYRNVRLEKPAPRRYVRLAQIIRGIADGYQDENFELSAFHALGLGASALFPIVAAAVGENTRLSTDATSPIHDAVRDLVLYDPDQDGNRITLVNIARRVVQEADWPCACPFCSSIKQNYGHKPDDARDWWIQEGRPPVTKHNLLHDTPLGSALPLLVPRHPRPMGTEVRRCHIAHNHWVLDALAAQIPDGIGRRTWGLNTIDKLESYESLTTRRGLQAASHFLT